MRRRTENTSNVSLEDGLARFQTHGCRSRAARFASQWTKLKNSSLKTHFSISRTGDWKTTTRPIVAEPQTENVTLPVCGLMLQSVSHFKFKLTMAAHTEASNNEPPPAVLKAHSMRWSFKVFVSYLPAHIFWAPRRQMTTASCHLQFDEVSWHLNLNKLSFGLLRKPVKESPIKALGNKTAVIEAQSIYNQVWHKLCKHRAKNVPQSENTRRSVRVFISENTDTNTQHKASHLYFHSREEKKKSLRKLKSWPCGCLTVIHKLPGTLWPSERQRADPWGPWQCCENKTKYYTHAHKAIKAVGSMLSWLVATRGLDGFSGGDKKPQQPRPPCPWATTWTPTCLFSPVKSCLGPRGNTFSAKISWWRIKTCNRNKWWRIVLRFCQITLAFEV